MTKTRFGVKNVGAPCEIFSMVPGIAPQTRRTRASCTPPSSFGAGPTFGAVRFLAIRPFSLHGGARSGLRGEDSRPCARHLVPSPRVQHCGDVSLAREADAVPVRVEHDK